MSRHTYNLSNVRAAVVVKGAQVVTKAAGWSSSTAESVAGNNSWGSTEAELDGVGAAVVEGRAQVVAEAAG